jgi:O-antigen/teichoic acid export membrane protein
MTAYTRMFVRGIFFVLLFSVLGAVAGYSTRVLYGHILSVEEFGLLYAVINFVIFLAAFRDFGLNDSVPKFIPEFKIKNRIRSVYNTIHLAFFVQMGIFSLITLTVLLFAGTIAAHYFHVDNAEIILRLVVIGFWVNCIVDIFCISFRGNNNIIAYASSQFIKPFTILAISIALFYLDFGFLSAIYANAFFSVVLLLIYLPVFIKKFPQIIKIRPSIDPKLARNIFRFSIPLVVGSLGAIGISFTDTLILTYVSGVEQVAFYNVAWPTAYFLMFFALSFAAVLMPLIAELWARKRADLISIGLYKIFKYLFMLLLPLAFIMINWSSDIVLLLFGEKFLPAGQAISILAIGFIFMNFASMSITALNGMGESRLSAKVMLIAALINLIANISLIPIFGFLGAAIGTSICYFSMFILSIIFLKRKVSIKLPAMAWTKTASFGLIFLAFMYLLKKSFPVSIVSTILIILAGTLIYFSLLLLFKVLSIEEIKETYHQVFR